MTSLVSGIYNRSMNIARVAKEIVADTYRSNNSAKEYLNDIKDKLTHIDQVYLDTAAKVTKEDPAVLKEKVEYRLLNFGTRNLTAAKDTAKAGLERLSNAKENVEEAIAEKRKLVSAKIEDKKLDARKTYIACRDSVTNTLNVKLESAKTKFSSLRSRSAIVYTSIKDQVAARYTSVKTRVSTVASEAAEKYQLKEYLNGVRERVTRLYNFSAEEAAKLKENFSKLYNYLTEKITSSELISSIGKAGRKAAENFMIAFRFLKETVLQNSQSLKRVTSGFSKLAENIKRKNGQMISFMRAENKKLLSNYYKKFEVEVFYTPTESVKLVEKTKDVVGKISHKIVGDDGKETFVATDHQVEGN